jgi:hypothetical protein
LLSNPPGMSQRTARVDLWLHKSKMGQWAAKRRFKI